MTVESCAAVCGWIFYTVLYPLTRILPFFLPTYLPSFIGHRIDVCASQALACALLCIRALLILATMYKGKFLDSFARSLKIGFLITFQSMLSTQGAELGMIEDLDISSLWLNLVSVRFVVKSERPKNKEEKLKLVEEDDELVFVGKGDGVYCRRDKVQTATSRMMMMVMILMILMIAYVAVSLLAIDRSSLPYCLLLIAY